jgi:hypothetical protein
MEGGRAPASTEALAGTGTLQGCKFLRLGESIPAANQKASARAIT